MTNESESEYVPTLSELVGDLIDDLPELPSNPLAVMQLVGAGSPEIDNFKGKAIQFFLELVSRIDQQKMEIEALRKQLHAVREVALNA